MIKNTRSSVHCLGRPGILAALGLVMLAAMAFASLAGPTGSLQSRLLSRSLAGLGANFNSLEDAFVGVALGGGIPGGVAQEYGCGGPRLHSFRIATTTVLQGLRSIVKANPNYRWDIRDGVLNLLPRETLSPLLTVGINEYASKEATNMTAAATLLLGVPAVYSTMVRLKLERTPDPVQIGLQALPPPGTMPKPAPPLNVRLRNTNTIGVLNAIVRANGHGVWIYREWHCGRNNGFRISFAN